MRIALLAVLMLLHSGSAGAQDKRLDFNRDVRPILSEHCFACHGPDERAREAGWRVDLPQHALQAAESGALPIVPGKPQESELIQRIDSADDDLRMPPSHMSEPLEPEQRDILRQWIAQGATYSTHWAYTPLVRPAVPTVSSTSSNAIDGFIAAGLADSGLSANAPADRVTLLRRLSFDLTGLPPTSEEVAAFVNDNSSDAYLRQVNRLLDSPRYGERMAIYWLDLVRYADTVGYHGDQDVTHWPYRDYVIAAFNGNLPYDRFILEQLAGDLLPNATEQQQIASAFNRLNQTTEEGGSQAKEYLAIYFADRVRNISQIFMGATLGCAQCHDHKYDPFTTRDFYAFGAFFADLEEVGVYGARSRPPYLRLPSEAQIAELEQLELQLSTLRGRQEKLKNKLLKDQAAWEETQRLVASSPAYSDDVPAAEAAESPRKQKDATAKPSKADQVLADALAIPLTDRHPEQKQAVVDAYLTSVPQWQRLQAELSAAEKRRQAIEEAVVKLPVSRAVEPRQIRILPRGNWMDDSGEVVQPAVPAFLGSLDCGDRRATRLDLAQWLSRPDNPLTARTMVNRLWYLMFGSGLCSSVDDLGGQGTFPSHPQLLDWLAVEFIESGWDIKHVLRTIALSQAYCRQSTPTETMRELDPYNKLLARQGRFRIDAEMIRDSVLATSGLLVETVGGPSCKPYQPAGYYAQLNFPRREYQADMGENQYRRGVYTHWQRTFLHPMLKAFDAPSREECTAARSRSSTPVQALTLLNDPAFVEASRVFAERIQREAGTDVEQSIAWAYQQVLSHVPQADVARELVGVFERHLEHYTQHPQEAEQLLSVGQAPRDSDLNMAETAAWTSVARVLFNLQETFTRY